MSYSPEIGKRIYSRYEIVKLLGSGGFGDTYLAVDLGLPGKPQCVVKHLKPKDPNPAVLPIAKGLFQREAETLYKLGNDCNQVPRLFAHCEENNEFYLVQEYIDGHDLSHELIPGTTKSEQVVVKLLQNILEVLAFVHKRNVIHRDIKPQNIMRRQSDGKIVLIDFGAVKEINVLSMTSTGQTSLTVAIGSPGYMSSEQAKGKPRFSSDVYAVGMIGIQALTGLLPHQLQEDPMTGEINWRHLVLINDPLASVLEKMVRDHFSQRYLNAAEASTALLALTQTKPKSTQQSQQQIEQSQLKSIAGNLLQGNASNEPSLATFQFETVTVDNRGTIIRRQNNKAKYFVEDLGNGVTLEMVQIPSGTFTMGSPLAEAKRDIDESPQRQVKENAFFMGKYVVTQAQYEAIIRDNPSRFKGANRPVDNVTWNEAVDFCKRLSQKTRRNYRLPSEAEWEYACRALTTTPFYFGETITTDLVNYNRTNSPYAFAQKGVSRGETTEVGKFLPNAFGLYDMHGNIREWCQDYWHDNYEGAPSDGSPWLRDGDNTRRTLRGGSWYDSPEYCRSARRDSFTPNFRISYIGFRLVVVFT